MLQFFKKTGRKKDIVRSPSLNIDRRSDIFGKDLAVGADKTTTAATLSTVSDDDILQAIENRILSESDKSQAATTSYSNSSTSTKNILRIVTDKNCLCYFVQYLEQKSALPLIKFWLDADSFRTAAELCMSRSRASPSSAITTTVSNATKHRNGMVQDRHHRVQCTQQNTSDTERTNFSNYNSLIGTQKGQLGKSISLDCGLLLSQDVMYTPTIEGSCKSTLGVEIDGYDDGKLNQMQYDGSTGSVRDSGDGSSDANSMTNLSDICEREGGDEVDKSITKQSSCMIKSGQDVDATSQNENNYDFDADEKFPIVDENGRKSAIGASADDDCPSLLHESHSKSSPNFQASLSMDAMRIFRKYLLKNGESTSLVDVPAKILSQISLALCIQNDSNSSVAKTDSTPSKSNVNDSIPVPETSIAENIASIFDEAQSFILDYLDSTFTNAFLESTFYCRYCVETLSGDNLKITDILHNEAALFYFMEFLENENKRQYLDFWLSAMNFKRQFDSDELDPTLSMIGDPDSTLNFYGNLTATEQAQNDALILYEKYFSLQATCPLHLSDRVRFQIEEKICSIDGGASSIVCCFDLPLAIVEQFLEQKYLLAFTQSNLFCKYLSELMQKIEHTKTMAVAAANQMQDNLTASTSSNTKFAVPSTQLTPRKDFASTISAQNTLLAMESGKKKKRAPQNRMRSTSDMCIDSRQLHDPDLLWRRNSIGGLNFGRVDALGRYERDYEMVPFAERQNVSNSATGHNAGSAAANDVGFTLQNTGNKIKQAVRKLVHLPEHRMQEEIAWQVAEMIVKDITNVTLHSLDEVDKEKS